jgi:hypothetical protein
MRDDAESTSPGEAGAPGNGSADASRYRRPERPAAASTDASGPNGSAGFAESEAHALVPGALSSRAMAEPLAALAAAFQANAEALRRSHEVQADLHRALERADRSDVMIQQTGALNDTFRGLTNIQRSLAQRIDASEQEARSGRMFLPVLVLASLAIVGAVVWMVVQYVERWRAQAVGNADVATRLSEQYEKGVAQGRADAAAAFEPERRAIEGRAKTSDDALAAARKERDERSAAATAALGELAALRAELSTARADPLKVRALEDEASRVRAESAQREVDVKRLERENADLRRDLADLRRRAGEEGIVRNAGRDAPPESPLPADDSAPARDRASVDRARGAVNALLKAGASGRSDYLQVLSASAVGRSRLLDVQVARYGPTGRLVNTIRAKEMTVVADRARRVVELQFAEGAIDRGGTEVPFPSYASTVAEGDSYVDWTTSGLPLLTVR